MKTGREIDFAVARKLGIPAEFATSYHNSGEEQFYTDAKYYSTNIEAAMEVVKIMESRDYHWEFHSTSPFKSYFDNKPYVSFRTYRNGVVHSIAQAVADTLEEAICLAILQLTF